MFKRILLATDGSEHSVRSAEHAIQLAKQFNGTIDVVYVVNEETSKHDVLHNGSKYEIERKRKEKVQLALDQLDGTAIDYNVQILHGEPGPSIVEYANKNDVDCVVIGSRGLNNLQTMILGSVSHKVAKRAHCPVLIVK
ncbi:Nucleotide-binding universal stress protein, UspA family [Lentibacillus persicus]|uniref:Universal stress protein n=1 Tax=Lentibacillus persicus TaxID=640948 RepID=A0A1I1RX83_9BACI|nr:universal stress protein [Lentibacillus persicus]SFD38707.1 Nucleotide-binding universal stress protein, UspA family [Lentibacillus persicus]